MRYLVGGAVGVARGEIREQDYLAGIEQAVEFAGTRAPAQGLILWEVLYPSAFDPFTSDDRAASAGIPWRRCRARRAKILTRYHLTLFCKLARLTGTRGNGTLA